MIQVQMVNDIRKYEVKSFGPFTKRQAVGILIAAVLAIPILFIPISLFARAMIVLILSAPIVAFADKKMWGMNAEVFLIRFIYSKFLVPSRRRQVRVNSYRESYNKLLKSIEKRNTKGMSSQALKEYEAKKHTVNYKTKHKNIVYT